MVPIFGQIDAIIAKFVELLILRIDMEKKELAYCVRCRRKVPWKDVKEHFIPNVNGIYFIRHVCLDEKNCFKKSNPNFYLKSYKIAKAKRQA